jgi:hypothetical protein
VGNLFSAVGAQVQEAFGYLPGRDVNEALPLVTFQANEWTEVGEPGRNGHPANKSSAVKEIHGARVP